MKPCVVDTNVPIVANGRSEPTDGHKPSLECRKSAVRFLLGLLDKGKILVDIGGEIQGEYHKHLRPSGQPGVGDRFYQEVLKSAPEKIERMELPKRADGEFVDLPQALIDANFDPSDRKFAALAKRAGVPVFNATDSDWLNYLPTLNASDIHVHFVCGCDPTKWFIKAT